jgi:hypothetical protein
VRAPRWVAVKPVRTRPPVHHGEGEGPVALPLPPVPPSRVTARSAQAPPLLPWIRGPSAKAWRWSERRRRARGRGRRPPPSQRLCPGAREVTHGRQRVLAAHLAAQVGGGQPRLGAIASLDSPQTLSLRVDGSRRENTQHRL